MATQPEEEDLSLEQPEGDQDDQQGDGEQQQEEQEEAPPEDEEEILIGDDTLPKETDSDLIRHLRSEIKRRDSLLAERPAAAPQKVEIGPKPSLWDDCEGDEDKYDDAMLAWHENKRRAEAVETEQEAGQRKSNEEFQSAVERFQAKKAELKVPGAQDAIDTAISTLPPASRAAIVLATKNPALVFAALGKHPGKLTEFAAIENPIRLAAEVALFEGTLKVGKRTAPPPEDVATGSARVSQERGDKEEQRLEKEGAKTGNYTALFAYRRNRDAATRKAGK